MTLHVKVGGDWKGVAPGGNFQVKVSGSWKTISAGYVRVSGSWEQFYEDIVYDLPDTGSYEDINPVSGGTSITLSMNSNGTFTIVGDIDGTLASGNWVNVGAPGTYHVRVDVTGGSLTSGTTGSDLALSSSRQWVKSIPGAGDEQVQFTLTLKDGSGGSTLATSTITFRVASA